MLVHGGKSHLKEAPPMKGFQHSCRDQPQRLPRAHSQKFACWRLRFPVLRTQAGRVSLAMASPCRRIMTSHRHSVSKSAKHRRLRHKLSSARWCGTRIACTASDCWGHVDCVPVNTPSKVQNFRSKDIC
jgi:hypothetical protein